MAYVKEKATLPWAIRRGNTQSATLYELYIELYNICLNESSFNNYKLPSKFFTDMTLEQAIGNSYNDILNRTQPSSSFLTS